MLALKLAIGWDPISFLRVGSGRSGAMVPAVGPFIQRKKKMSTPKKTRYTLIKGAYWIHSPDKPRQGPQPDGDTVSFAPDSRDLVL